jgi:hypothetical protein
LMPSERKFGRVVKALALGASLERGMGSNPIACNNFWQVVFAHRDHFWQAVNKNKKE